MADLPNQIFFPLSYSELFASWNRYPDAVPFAGGTGILREQGRKILALPPIILSLDRLEEMQRITRTERYLEIGAMAKLSQIVDLGNLVPKALRRCLESIAGQQLRNMATIGGNLCYPGRCLDSAAVFAALDGQYELRSAQSSRWISASRFFSSTGQNVLNPQEVLTRIRVPLENWDYTSYRKFAGQANQSRTAVFLVKIQKNILTDIKIIYKTALLWRDKNIESKLIGNELPLNRRIAADFVEHWDAFLSGIDSIDALSRKEMTNYIAMNVYNLSE
ncbi:MAG: FAD binding domain-containing protein [Treponema sp.]|jgi:CO/xanthine dehydrogenase FAD-binding subunit|nr:FAD binding domain-containing protein [Treponema sp.]